MGYYTLEASRITNIMVLAKLLKYRTIHVRRRRWHSLILFLHVLEPCTLEAALHQRCVCSAYKLRISRNACRHHGLRHARVALKTS